MKIIHTSDWHLGHQLYNYDREDEQRFMLAQMEQLVRDEQPDALLVSGDVFHTAQPSAAAQTMLVEALMQLRKACPAMTIILTAGNHDSGAKHEIFRKAWQAFNIHVVGHIDKDHPEQLIIPIGGEAAEGGEGRQENTENTLEKQATEGCKGLVVAVPFVSSRNLPEDFYQAATAAAEQASNAPLPIILMAHTTVLGADFSGHEEVSQSEATASVGGIDAVPLEAFGKSYDYLALGHIHKHQWVQGSGRRARYSGTPMPISFDETFCHTVSIVELSAHGEQPQVREVEIPLLRPLVSLPLAGPAPWEEALAALRDFEPEQEGTYIRLAVCVSDFLPPTKQAEAQDLATSKGCRFCYIQCSREERTTLAAQALTVDELQREAPIDIARRYVEDKGLNWDDELAALFREAEQSILEEERK